MTCRTWDKTLIPRMVGYPILLIPVGSFRAPIPFLHVSIFRILSPYSAYSTTLKVEMTHSSETLMNICQTAQNTLIFVVTIVRTSNVKKYSISLLTECIKYHHES
jgi:hypothetical protein